MKTFKDFINEVKILGDVHKSDATFLGQLGSEHQSTSKLRKSYTPKSTTSFTGQNGKKYHVTFAKDNRDRDGKSHAVFVHHEDENGKFKLVGGIHGNHNEKTNTFDTTSTGLTGAHQGHGVMADAYKHLVKHHGLNLRSSNQQSTGGNSIWRKMHEDPEIHVKLPKDATGNLTTMTASKR